MRKFPQLIFVVFFISVILIVFLLNSRFEFFNKIIGSGNIGNSNSNLVGSCGFLDEDYCDDGTIQDVEYAGNNYRVVGFKLPEGVEIKVPFEAEIITGAFDETSTLPLKGDSVIITKKQDLSQRAIIVGDLEIVKYNDWIRPQGATVAKIGKGKKTNLDGYNLVIMFMNSTGGKEAPNEEMLDRYF